VTVLHYGGALVPWNASWTGEARYEVRPCRYAGGRRAMWAPHAPGVGKPVFAKPHFVRQRRSIMELRCTVCGEETPAGDRWWFQLGDFNEGWFMTAEAPVHHACALLALEHCPHLRGRESALERFPAGSSVLFSIIAGAAVERDFGPKVSIHQPVIGHLKLAWPQAAVRRAS
jgi:hypothetical protein